MAARTRKLIGAFALLAYMIVYCLAAMGVAANYVLQYNGLVQGAYFVIAGFAWLPPAMWLVKWMQKPDPA